ncbi:MULTISPECIES: 3-dehydroquinate synthase [unclassified Lentimonas]|nr:MULTISPECIES: 3-dehydroquinate synthase [unclassified Lentimonas]CAA6683735.1 3-dehydroquinate synthase (EC [Lentimonas sp. CC6]CAA6678749.1 3-dehydroquinate synthase (EC [Lentimonas sp. CC4]CAA7074417.1 3-dehydroquinate synthase (EC [Lentimonas sp. CC4]CAA7169027.1 3-dehydroquinate synthase (EC [Lentimonas sp. CC21]CAA7180566.1 3-dehydroquinate synthase (EC [Lentimonas sp. CC8]
MSEELKIKSVFREYTVEFTSDYLSALKGLATAGDFFIVDRVIAELHPEILEIAGEQVWLLDSMESAKSYEGVIPLFERLIEGGFRKNHRLFAFGGGITQDVTAYIASLLYRGIDWFFFPTNMLTQCDSCIGSKTSINFRQYKNMLGGFYPPAGIVIDTGFVKSLGDREIASGLGEMLHYMMVQSEEDLALFMAEAPALRAGEGRLEVLMHRSLAIKKAMIEIDEFDKGPRCVFNYGHSFGHALESAVGYALPHGIAVAYGIDLANLVSESFGLITMEDRNRYRKACEIVFDGHPVPEVNIDKYLSAIRKDKKNVGTQLGLILTRGAGDMFKRLSDLDGRLETLIAKFFADKLYMKDL